MLPWDNTGFHRRSELDAGMAELQTDVMRFMAILAFCLVAIFAIVQSFPLVPPDQSPDLTDVSAPAGQRVSDGRVDLTPPAEARAVPRARPLVPTREPALLTVAESPTPPRAVRTPAPARPLTKAPAGTLEPLPPVAGLRTSARVPAPVAIPEEPAPSVPEPKSRPADVAAATDTEKVFSLRFDSESVLRSLVERGLVALYAVDGDHGWELWANGELAGFRVARPPGEMHVMVAASVPGAIASALARDTAAAGGEVVWGVTLPGEIRRQIDVLLRSVPPGPLVIGAAGAVTRE